MTTAAGPPGQCGAPVITLSGSTCATLTWEVREKANESGRRSARTRPRALTVFWPPQSPEGSGTDISEYRLEWGRGEEPMELIYCGAATQCELSELTPATDYCCRLQVKHAFGATWAGSPPRFASLFLPLT